MNSPDELFTTSEPFCTQNSRFALGIGYNEVDMLVEPEPFYNQLVYASSAGRTDGYFFRKYRECSIRMDAGDKRYFCADIDCNVVLKATKRGIALPEALLTQDKIDSAMRKDKLAAMREYYNKFETEGSDQQIIRRSDIARLSFPYIPELKNRDDASFYALAYDPARRQDGSVISVARFWEDPKVGWKMRIVNCILLIDRLSKEKRMQNTPNQVEALKQIIIDYNGEGVADYENIIAINVDSGSGGAGVNITDFIANDFEVGGDIHRGLVDDEFNEGDAKKFPNAVRDKLHLISPIKYKSEMFEEAIQMVSQNLVEFPQEYNDRGYVDLIYEIDADGKRTQRFSYPTEKEEKELRKKKIQVETVRHNLDRDEEAALIQIEAMKTEICNMYRFKQQSGKDRFELAPDKVDYLHDDRNYTFILLCHILSNLRRDHIINRRRTDTKDLADILPMRRAKRERLMS